MKTRIITVDRCEKSTDKAYLFWIDGISHWIPKSVVVNKHEPDYIYHSLPRAWEIQDWFLAKMDVVGATFSDDNKRRYQLWRVWNPRKKQALCIGLNPSTANNHTNDQTIDRLSKYLSALDYGGMRMVNLFTYISTDPTALLLEEARGNKEEDMGIIFANSLLCQDVIFCWGSFTEGKDRQDKLKEFYTDALCFGVTKGGDPWHPLACFYAGLKGKDVKLFKFREHQSERNIDKRKNRTTRVNHDNAQVPLKFSETNAVQRMR